MEAERLKELKAKHAEELAAQEKRKLKELHYMRCPKCGMEMTTSILADVEIDVCPDCNGIYLDSGELSKLLEEGKSRRVLKTVGSVRRLLGL